MILQSDSGWPRNMERRKRTRYPLLRPAIISRIGKKGMSEAAVIQNISAAGLLLQTGISASVGKIIQLAVELSSPPPVLRLEITGRIVRAAAVPSGQGGLSSYEIGITFGKCKLHRDEQAVQAMG